MKVHSWSKPHTFQFALRMLSADHLNIDGPLFPVKCVRKFRSALCGEVTYRGVQVCVLTRQNKSGCCAFSVHVKSILPTESGHTRCQLLVLISVLNSSSLKTQELPPKLWSSLSLLLALKLFLESLYSRMKVRSWSKPHTFQSTFHTLSIDHLNIDGPPFPVKRVRKFGSTLGGEVMSTHVVCTFTMEKRKKFGKSQEFLFYHSCRHNFWEPASVEKLPWNLTTFWKNLKNSENGSKKVLKKCSELYAMNKSCEESQKILHL